MSSKVYITKEISPESVVNLYKLVEDKFNLTGNIAIKVHTGEKGNTNFIKPKFWQPIVEYVKGTVVETNTAYGGNRSTTSEHTKILREHDWIKTFDYVDLLDADGPDKELLVKNGYHLQSNLVGKNIAKYDSMMVLSHFKGHRMAGYGGALKQLAIGCASSKGKARIHGAGDTSKFWETDQDLFIESMVDAASTIIDYFSKKIVYVNVMKNISLDCDCFGDAVKPCMKDIAVLISDDPVAIDSACLHLIYTSKDPGKDELIKRIESKHGPYIIECAVEKGLGSKDFTLVNIEQEKKISFDVK